MVCRRSQSLLISTAAYEQNVYKSARNINQVSVSPAAELNALNVLSVNRLLITTGALDLLKERAASANSTQGNGAKA